MWSVLLLHFSSADYFSMLHGLKLSFNEEMTMKDFLGWDASGCPIKEFSGDHLCLKICMFMYSFLPAHHQNGA